MHLKGQIHHKKYVRLAHKELFLC